jgi:hypothetical protein
MEWKVTAEGALRWSEDSFSGCVYATSWRYSVYSSLSGPNHLTTAVVGVPASIRLHEEGFTFGSPPTEPSFTSCAESKPVTWQAVVGPSRNPAWMSDEDSQHHDSSNHLSIVLKCHPRALG